MKKFNLVLILSLIMAFPLYGFGEKLKNSDHMNGCDMAGMGHENQKTSQKIYSGDIIDNVRVIQVCAKDYKFYPSVITVKKGEKVRLMAKSLDKLHGIEIKELKINQELPLNEEKKIEFIAQKAGEFHFHCSVYCGPGHSNMHGTLIIKE